MEDEINLWLKSKRKYSTGLELFDKYVKIRSLSQIFHVGGPTPKNKQTLAYELNKLLVSGNYKCRKSVNKNARFFASLIVTLH